MGLKPKKPKRTFFFIREHDLILGHNFTTFSLCSGVCINGETPAIQRTLFHTLRGDGGDVNERPLACEDQIKKPFLLFLLFFLCLLLAIPPRSYLTCHGAAWIPLNQHSYFLPSCHHDLPFDVRSITSKPYTPY